MKTSFWLLVAVFGFGTIEVASAEYSGPGLRRCKTKEMSDYACGQCEPKLQKDFDALLSKVEAKQLNSVEEFLTAMSPEMKANYTLVGDSKSLQKSTPEFPRVMFKSPEAELWVTISTDPKQPEYQTLEIMRWDGKAGKFQFQEVDFGNKQKVVHRDASKKCAECHKTPNRPNFDTYVSWASFIPPRDDVLERYISDANGTEPKGPDGKPIPDPNTKAYLNFIDRVAAARKTSSTSRLRALEIPPFHDSKTPDDVKIKRIREGIEAQAKQTSAGRKYNLRGYRIGHNPPDLNQINNYDSATVNGAGFNHVAFDQLTDLNFCQVATNLKKSPEYPSIKYAFTAAMQCYSNPADLLPEWAQNATMNYFKSKGVGAEASTPKAIVGAVQSDVSKRMSDADNQKSLRHQKTVEKMGLSPEIAKIDAETVRGVGEDGTGKVAAARFLLEPLGMRVQDWSMTFGDNLAQPTYNFADQFNLLTDKQEIFEEIRKEHQASGEGGDYCNWLQKKSLAAWDGVKAKYPKSTQPDPEAKKLAKNEENPISKMIDLCKKLIGLDPSKDCIDCAVNANEQNGPVKKASGLEETMKDIGALDSDARAKKLFAKHGCQGCHSSQVSSNGKLVPWSKAIEGHNLANWLNQSWVDAPPGAPKGATMLDKAYWAIENKFPSDSNFNMPPYGAIESAEEKAEMLSYLVAKSLSKQYGEKAQVCEARSMDLANVYLKETGAKTRMPAGTATSGKIE